MEPRAPQWPSPPLRPERGLRRGAYYRPQSWHDGERVRPRQDLRGSPQTQPDARATSQHPASVPRLREWFPPVPGADYYDASYTGHLYPQPSLETLYQSYGSLSREDYAYSGYYHQGHHPAATGEKRPQGWDPYWGSPGPGRPGHLPAESLRAGPQGETSLPSESNLLAQQESGLSSSGFELSQYMEDATEMRGSAVASVWSPVQAEEVSAAEPQSPMKFYVPHTPLSFGPGGQLVLGCPHIPRDGQTAVVELHSMEVLLNDSEEQEEMRIFSGPLIREVHKVDIMTFCQEKVAQSSKADTLQSPDSALLWKLLVLLCRQNGSMVGSDIAELLMEDCKKLDQYKPQPSVATSLALGDEDWPALSSGTPNLLTGEIPPSVETPEQAVEKFTKLLYFGRKKAKALEWAMKNHLWGHALFLSSKMDPRTYSLGFTSTLVLNDPLQTLFQLMSGRIPQAATCCGDRQWGDWRPHLAVMLSNQGGDPELHQRAIITMGDTLASKGLVEAAHFCYLMAQVPFGHYTVKTDYLALLGSSHSQAFLKFATTEAIQRTEIFEYCPGAAAPRSFLPSFQVYKLLYAARLAGPWPASQALHYCEAISRACCTQAQRRTPVLLLAELIKLAERLKLSDPLLSERRSGDRESEPDWLMQLRRQQEALQPKGVRDAGHLCSAHPAGSGVGRVGTGSHMDELRNSPSSDSQGLGGHPGAARDSSAPRPPPEQPSQAWPRTQQPLPFLPGSSPVEGDATPVETPVPLYPVPQAPVPASWDSRALPEAPAGLGLAEAALTPGEPTPPEPFQPLYGVQVPPSTQVTSSPKAPGFLESPAKEEQGEEEEEDEKEEEDEEEKSLPNFAAREKQGDGKGNPKGSGFGWFSWFRSKPSSSSSSGDEDSSRSDSEETPGAQSGPLANPGPSLLPATESQPPMGISTGEAPGALAGGGAARVTGSGGLPELAASPPELSFTPGFLLPPPSFQGGVPLYNPAQVPQLSPRTGQNRPNRLAQRRYPAQPAQL
ncbi:LOW QUALITY PROTEIN: protein transport protein Sec16B [Suncus etruscus]|uniref:LOW QUALITY PROTEIN: protein transport protein Sec16B n=1 Tax=Suncus etruscus TaxID=109475 RepID=UPI0021103295|nr:LOW QUALITY PROTEIN: protein transport protein Sec16B [Suncus etruscus]